MWAKNLLSILFLSTLLLSAAAPAVAEEEAPPDRRRSAAAIQPHSVGPATLWIDPADWTWVRSDREDTLAFVYRTGLAQARLTWRQDGLSEEEALESVMEGVREIDPAAKVIFEEERRVQGMDVLCVQIKAQDDKKQEIVYYGQLWSDGEQTVRLFNITLDPALGAYYEDLTELLDGLEIKAEAAE